MTGLDVQLQLEHEVDQRPLTTAHLLDVVLKLVDPRVTPRDRRLDRVRRRCRCRARCLPPRRHSADHGRERRQTLKLVKEGPMWRIADIIDDKGKSLHDDLMAIAEKAES